MELILGVSLLISLISVVFITPLWIKKMKEIGLQLNNLNKFGFPKELAPSGGTIVVMGFVLGVLYYIAIRTFLFSVNDTVNTSIFAIISVILILTIVGIVDDFFEVRKNLGDSIRVEGLSKKIRILLAFVASIPLVVINAGHSWVDLPLFGNINLGLWYPLLLIPVGIAGATITYNFLAGFNGLETGQGILILGFLSFVAYYTGTAWLAIVGLCMVFALIGFYVFNKYPATVLPGDSLTWSIGALIASMAIIGNFEKIAIIVFIPYIIEFFLKCRGKLQKQSFGKVNPDNSLEMPYNKIYGLTHVAIWTLKKIKKKVYEKDVSYFIFAIQIIFILIGFLMLL